LEAAQQVVDLAQQALTELYKKTENVLLPRTTLRGALALLDGRTVFKYCWTYTFSETCF